jgi:predicted nucleotidyltransferase
VISPRRDERLAAFLSALRRRFGRRVRRVALFGSRARGEAVADSDYDLLVVLDRVSAADRETVVTLEAEQLLERGAVFSTFLLSPAGLRRRRGEPFLINAQREGVAL